MRSADEALSKADDTPLQQNPYEKKRIIPERSWTRQPRIESEPDVHTVELGDQSVDG